MCSATIKQFFLSTAVVLSFPILCDNLFVCLMICKNDDNVSLYHLYSSLWDVYWDVALNIWMIF